MNLSEIFIVRPVMTVLLSFAIFFAGVLAYYQLPVSNLPDVNYPTIEVQVPFPGALPETMANTVALPLEKEFMTIPGISEVTSTNLLGSTNIVLQFDVNKDIDSAAQDVQAAISRARANLPPNLPNEPSYRKVNPSDTPIIYIALTSDTMPLTQVYTYGFTYIAQQISKFPGVAQVVVYGSPFAVRVQVDPGSLAAKGVTMSDVATAVARSNSNLPTGQLDGPFRSTVLNSEGQLTNAEGYNPLIVAYRNGAPVRIEDVGQAIDSLQNDKINLRYVDDKVNQPTVVIAVQRQPGANTIKVAQEVKNFLPTLSKVLPASLDLKVVFDRSLSIEESVAEVKFTLVLAFVLVVLVIFIYLGKLAETIIPTLILPMSILATFIAMYFFNYTIDNLSLLALTLAIGFIIDDAIVVVENIVGHVEAGEPPLTAAINGSKQISFTILSMTLSLVAVFIPLLFMGGLIGKIFQEFSVTLMVVTLASGVISLTLTPMLSSRFIQQRNHASDKNFFERFSNNLNGTMLNWYEPGLKWSLNHRPLLLFIGLLCLVLTIVFFRLLPTDFIPDDDIGFIIAYNQAAEGTSSKQMYEYQDKLIKLLQSKPYIGSIVSIAATPDNRQGLNFIRLVPRHDRPSSSQIIQQLQMEVLQIPGVNTFLKNIPLIDLSIGATNRGTYQFVLQSTDDKILYPAAEKLMDEMRKDPIFQGISSDMAVNTPQLNIKILRDKASTLGVEAQEIENTLLFGFARGRVSRIKTSIDQYDVIVELLKDLQASTASLNQLYVRSKTTNDLIPLSAVAEWSEGIGPSSISHLSQFPAVTINFNIPPGTPLSVALERLQAIVAQNLPPNVNGAVKGAAETFESSLKSASYLLIFAVVAIYIVLGILYESFIHPLTILSTLPPAVLGGLATLWMLNMPLSLYGYLGLILLIGIVKKNGIMMVDYAIDYIANEQKTPEEAIYKAALDRFRPIMMTTISAVFGAIPIALAIGAGAEARRPLGWVIIGGLLFSQLITLFLTPVVYLYMEKYNQRFSFSSIKENAFPK